MYRVILIFVSKLAVLPHDSLIFRIHILLNFEILFLEAYRFQNPEGLEGLKEYALRFVSKFAVLPQNSRIFRIHILLNFAILFSRALYLERNLYMCFKLF